MKLNQEGSGNNWHYSYLIVDTTGYILHMDHTLSIMQNICKDGLQKVELL